MTELTTKKRTAENIRIGLNLRTAILRACAKNPDLSQKEIAARAHVHPVSLSRIVRGYGASVETISRIAEVVGADGARIIEIGKRKPKFSVKSIVEVINDDRVLNQFVLGTDKQGLEWAKAMLAKTFSEIQAYNRKKQLTH